MSSSRCARIAIALLAALDACTGPTSPAAGVAVTLTVSAPTVSTAAPIEVVVTVANRRRSPITITANQCPAAFVVRDASGQIVGPEGEICPAALERRTLAPGESYQFRHPWAGVGWNRETNAVDAPLPPGTYRLEGRVAGEEVAARSARVAVQVTR